MSCSKFYVLGYSFVGNEKQHAVVSEPSWKLLEEIGNSCDQNERNIYIRRLSTRWI